MSCCGPQVLGVFANGRIEAFLTAKTLTPAEMSSPAFVPCIATQLRRLHAVPTDGVPTLWQTIDRWLSMARSLSFEDAAKQAKFDTIDFAAQQTEESMGTPYIAVWYIAFCSFLSCPLAG